VNDNLQQVGAGSRRTWATACIEMDPLPRPGETQSAKRAVTTRYSEDIQRMQREFALGLLARKGVRV
jgi:hypothetical protein